MWHPLLTCSQAAVSGDVSQLCPFLLWATRSTKLARALGPWNAAAPKQLGSLPTLQLLWFKLRSRPSVGLLLEIDGFNLIWVIHTWAPGSLLALSLGRESQKLKASLRDVWLPGWGSQLRVPLVREALNSFSCSQLKTKNVQWFPLPWAKNQLLYLKWPQYTFPSSVVITPWGWGEAHAYLSCFHTFVHTLFSIPASSDWAGQALRLSSFESEPPTKSILGPSPLSSQLKLCLQHSVCFLNTYPVNTTKLNISHPVSPARHQDSRLEYLYVPPRALNAVDTQ